MLKGKEFGAAIGEAIKKKLAKDGGPQSKAEIARHFKMKPPAMAVFFVLKIRRRLLTVG